MSVETAPFQPIQASSTPFVFPTNRKRFLIPIGFLLVFLIIVGIVIWLKEPQRMVTTTGIGKQTFHSNSATIGAVYYIQAVAKTDATAQGKQGSTQLFNLIRGMGVDSVALSAPQVVPITTAGGVLYEYRQAAQISVTGQEKIQAVLDELDGTNVIVGQIAYLPDENEQVQAQLFAAAMADAQTKAQSLAQLSGAHIGKVMNVTESTTTDTNGSALTVQTAGTQTNPQSTSDVQLEKDVTVTYQLW